MAQQIKQQESSAKKANINSQGQLLEDKMYFLMQYSETKAKEH